MLYKLEFLNKVTGAGAKKVDFMAVFKRGIKVLERQKLLSGLMNGGVVQLALVGDAEIRQVNNMYRNIDKPTDVVSLSYFDQGYFPEDSLTGEIIISIDTAKRQAKEHKHSLNEELRFLFAHGLLHIFGYDHLKAGERKAMFELQDEVLK
jgi:probable rRNA maturation factor